MVLRELPNYHGYDITDLPHEYSTCYEPLRDMLRRLYRNDGVIIDLVDNNIMIRKLKGSVLVLSSHTTTLIEGFLMGWDAGFKAGIDTIGK